MANSGYLAVSLLLLRRLMQCQISHVIPRNIHSDDQCSVKPKDLTLMLLLLLLHICVLKNTKLCRHDTVY